MQDFKQTIQTMLQQGYKDEEKVMKITEEVFKCPTVKATLEEDRKQHVDFWCFSKGKKYGIDVKGLHKNNRTDKKYDDTIQWVELQNVLGNKGWVYGNTAYIAFLTTKEIIYVPTKRLAKFAEDKIKGKDLTNLCPKDFYIPYQRKNRKDIIVKIPTKDLSSIATHVIPYN